MAEIIGSVANTIGMTSTLNVGKGDKGETGESAYEYAVSKGYTGTESQFAQAQYDSATQIPSLSAEIQKMCYVDDDGLFYINVED